MPDPIVPPTGSPQPGQIPSSTQPLTPAEQQIRIMRGDLGAPPTPIKPAGEPKLNIPLTGAPPAAATPGKPLFDADEPVFTPNTANIPPIQGKASPVSGTQTITAPSVDALIAAQHGRKKTGMLVGGLVGLVVLAGIGYFVYPMLTKTQEPAQQPTQPVIPIPVTTAPAEPIVPAQLAFPSLFKNEPVKRTTLVAPEPLTVAALNETLAPAAAPAGSAEALYTDASSTPLSFVKLIGVLAPSLKDQTAIIFNGQVSVYVYTDETGHWPGYVAKINPSSTPQQIKDWFTALENTSAKKNFFIGNPGTLGAFKNGTVNNTYPDRYSTGTTKGASFGYLILPEEGIILISTSYAGMRDGLRLLGH